MYLSITDKNKKVVHTHTSLLEEENQGRIKKIYETQSSWQTRGAFIATYLGLEVVNRIKPLSNLHIYKRIPIVGALTLAGGILGSQLYWRTQGEPELRKNLVGAPVYENKFDVPELDKLYFFLDDDNNYEPSLYHHGM